MVKENFQLLFSNLKLIDLYSYIFSISKNKNTNANQQKKDDEDSATMKPSRLISNSIQYDKISKKLGIVRDLKVYEKKFKDISLESLFDYHDFHNKVVQSIFISCDPKQVSSSEHERLKSFYLELIYCLDYFERELVNLRGFYVIDNKNSNESILDEIIRKFFVPQICCYLSQINNLFPSDFKGDYLIIKSFRSVFQLILSNNFNITAAFKQNLTKFVEYKSKEIKSLTILSTDFGNINDDDFPTLARLKKWIIENHLDPNDKDLNKLYSRHILFSIFIKIKKTMKKHQIKYAFKSLINDIFIYYNLLTEPKLKKLKFSENDDTYKLFRIKKSLIDEHFNYFLNHVKTERLHDVNFFNDPDETIYQSLNFRNTNKLPHILAEYLKFGVTEINFHEHADELIELLKKHDKNSEGFYIICLFTEAIKYLICDNIKSAKEKIEQAYAEMDKYPIGNIFYKNIFYFYIGICDIKKINPNQFTKKINSITNYSRFMLSSPLMQNEYNISDRKELPTTSYVEDIILLRSMSNFNKFCYDHNLDKDLFFNPYSEIEYFHSVISAERENLFYGENINSFSVVIDYKNSPYYKDLCKKKIFKNTLKKDPKVNFTKDGLEDFYRYREFYLANIEELGLTNELQFTMEILTVCNINENTVHLNKVEKLLNLIMYNSPHVCMQLKK